MKCLRCGYCCIAYDVIVPLSKEEAAYKPNGQLCWNLEFNGEEAYCKIHEEDFFIDSPCDQFTQIEQGETNCRMGDYVKGGGKAVLEHFKAMPVAVPKAIKL